MNVRTVAVRINAEPGNQARIRNATSGSTLYYADAQSVSSSSNDGSIAAGSSATFSAPVWVVSASFSEVGVDRPSTRPAYTQTYSTAARSVPNATVAAVATTAATQTDPYGFAGATQADAIPVAINALTADVLALRKVVTALIDDLQAQGIVT